MYELWDVESGNIVAEYTTEKAALAALGEYVQDNGPVAAIGRTPMPDSDERESPRATERSAPASSAAPAERGLSDDTELVALGGDRCQVRQSHRIIGTLVESGSGHQAFSVMGRALGTFSSRRKAVDAMVESL